MSFDFYAAFATNLKEENEGVPMPFNGTNFIIARTGNKGYSKALTAAVEANQAVLDLKNDEADAKSDEIMIDVAANHLIKGWDKMPFNGENLPYSVENAKTILGIKDLRVALIKMADDREKFKVVKVQAQVKN